MPIPHFGTPMVSAGVGLLGTVGQEAQAAGQADIRAFAQPTPPAAPLFERLLAIEGRLVEDEATLGKALSEIQQRLSRIEGIIGI